MLLSFEHNKIHAVNFFNIKTIDELNLILNYISEYHIKSCTTDTFYHWAKKIATIEPLVTTIMDSNCIHAYCWLQFVAGKS